MTARNEGGHCLSLPFAAATRPPPDEIHTPLTSLPLELPFIPTPS